MSSVTTRFGICVLGVGMAAHQAAAADLLVPSQYPTIQAAIDSAGNGDVVQVSPGSYTGPIDMKGKVITVRGTADAANVVVSGGGSVLQCINHETSATVIENLTLTGGTALVGAGVRLEGASPTIRNCRIIGNVVAATGYGPFILCGAGISIRGGSPVVAGCLIAANAFTCQSSDTSYARGAGVYVESTTATFTDCVVSGNSITAWGGCFAHGAGAHVAGNGNPSFLRCRFSSNSHYIYYYMQTSCQEAVGMAMCADAGSHANLNGCEFSAHGDALGPCGTSAVVAIQPSTTTSATIINVSNCSFCGNSGINVSGPYVDLGHNRISASCASCIGDLDGDGAVNGADLGLLLSKWGACSN
jgi:hypothetical protein